MTPPIGLKTAGPDVVLVGIVEQFLNFIAHLDAIHQLLFGHQLIITSGVRDLASSRSLHSLGRAVDIRTEDKDPQANMLFLAVLAFAAEAMPITVFDERNLPGMPHLHVEWHGQ